jgi:hypothetical protein
MISEEIFIMNRILLTLTIFILLLSSCIPSFEEPTPTAVIPTVTQTTEPEILSGAPTIEPTLASLQLAVYPPEARTNIEALDSIIDAVLKHDFQALLGLTNYSRIGCTHTDGLGGPPKCNEDESEGTPIESIPFLGPEGHHMRRAEYESWEGPDAIGLLAVYKTSQGTFSDPSYPAGDYALVFLLSRGPEKLILQVMEGMVVRYDYYLGELTEDDLNKKSSQMILPLTFNPIPTPVSWNQYIDLQDRFSFLYPPTMELTPGNAEDKWILGDRIRIEILPYEISWITCFYRGLGDCPFVESDRYLTIHDSEVHRVEGYIGSVGGNIPQEFLTYVFDRGDQALVFTVYALPFGTQVDEPSTIWPLEGMELELFEQTVKTVRLID